MRGAPKVYRCLELAGGSNIVNGKLLRQKDLKVVKYVSETKTADAGRCCGGVVPQSVLPEISRGQSPRWGLYRKLYGGPILQEEKHSLHPENCHAEKPLAGRWRLWVGPRWANCYWLRRSGLKPSSCWCWDGPSWARRRSVEATLQLLEYHDESPRDPFCHPLPPFPRLGC